MTDARRLKNGMVLPPRGPVMVARDGALTEVDVAELVDGDWVAQPYGEGFYTAIPLLPDVTPARPYGSQLKVDLPSVIDEDLALLLGMYASEGHTSQSNYSIVVTNNDEQVLARCVELWDRCFGLKARITRQADRCPGVVVSSKTVVGFFDMLDCGKRASNKRIPAVVMGSPRPVVLAFLQGLALDAFTATTGPNSLWGICVDSRPLLDDLQLLLRWLGIRSSRQAKWNAVYRKHYDQVTLSGTQAQALVRLVPFLEATKTASAQRLLATPIDQRRDGADLVPLVHGSVLYECVPKGRSGRSGAGSGTSREWRSLCDSRTTWPSRRLVARLAAAGYSLPGDVQRVLDESLYFSTVAA